MHIAGEKTSGIKTNHALFTGEDPLFSCLCWGE
jgi:hypothetical protein